MDLQCRNMQTVIHSSVSLAKQVHLVLPPPLTFQHYTIRMSWLLLILYVEKFVTSHLVILLFYGFTFMQIQMTLVDLVGQCWHFRH